MKTAMILAAGRGERLKPLTEKIPKAMCVVQEKPLIEHHVNHLAEKGIERIVINHAYLGGQIRRHLGNGAKWGVEICYTPEPPGGLETGGGIFNALPLLGDSPFITLNADLVSDFDYSSLKIPEDALTHLVLVKNPLSTKGDFGLVNQKISRESACYTFSGIACYRPEAFQSRKIGRYSVTPLLHELIEQNKASGEFYSGFWVDIGSLEGIQLANQRFM